jgi:hypothetical protein
MTDGLTMVAFCNFRAPTPGCEGSAHTIHLHTHRRPPLPSIVTWHWVLTYSEGRSATPSARHQVCPGRSHSTGLTCYYYCGNSNNNITMACIRHTTGVKTGDCSAYLGSICRKEYMVQAPCVGRYIPRLVIAHRGPRLNGQAPCTPRQHLIHVRQVGGPVLV